MSNPHTGCPGCPECVRIGAALRCGGVWRDGVYINIEVGDGPPEQPLWARVVATCIVAGFVLWVMGLLWWVVGAAAVCAAAWWLHGLIHEWREALRRDQTRLYRPHHPAWRDRRRQEIADRRRLQTETAARADQQHRWFMAGDDRGVYGTFPPADIEKRPPPNKGEGP